MNERRKRVEDPDLHVPALEPDWVRQRVAVDRRTDDGRVDEADIDVRQARLPRDRSFGFTKGLALDEVDQLLELAFADRLIRFLALLAVGRGEALDELAGDPDDDLLRPEAGHFLGFLEGHGAVVDDRRDVGDGAGLHVAEALALPPNPADRAMTVGSDLEDEGLGELRADVERRALGDGLVRVALEDLPPERHSGARFGSGADRRRDRGQPVGQSLAARSLALGHLRPAATAAIDLRDGHAHEIARRDSANDEVVADRHEDLWLVRVEAERDDT